MYLCFILHKGKGNRRYEVVWVLREKRMEKDYGFDFSINKISNH